MSRSLPALSIEGVAFWATRLPGWAVARSVMRNEQTAPEVNAPRPAPTLLAPTERRRAPDTVAVALEVATRACAAAGRSPANLPAVFASTHGDLAISDYMCATLVSTPTLISPIKFHNSVHNAAGGYWSIGVGSTEPYTAISAYEHTFGAGLLEAATQAACEQRPVLYVAFDIEAKGPLASMARSQGLFGVGLVLGPRDRKHPGLALTVRSTDKAKPTQSRSPAAALIQHNALVPALPLFEQLAQGDSGELSLSLSCGAELLVQIHAAEVA